MCKPLLVLAVVFFLASSGCSAESEPEPKPTPVMLRLTLENISTAQTFLDADGQPVTLALAPGVFVVTRDASKLYGVGQEASKALEILAETGSPVEFLAQQEGAAHVSQAGIIGDVNNPDYKESPLMPGGRAGFVVELEADARLVIAMMLGPSNDTFLGTPDGGIALDALKEGEQTMILQWWDAGTEVNESLGRGEHQVSQAPGTETGQEEGGTVHRGLVGVDGPEALPLLEQVVRLTVERL